ncbi:MAG: 3'(2'),5'-bisphosphate nucleotidase [Candidatus Hydrogenedentes bacterium]|nr:3'(2'),5'-bisphosphate nucleotidase [Candidatus Hydrogenedentota bacterium]
MTSKELQFAAGAVAQACAIARAVQTELTGQALTKDDKSPVTVADFAVQALIARNLAGACPDDALVGEEDANTLRTSGAEAILGQVTAYVRRFAPDATPETVCQWIDRGAAEASGRFWTLDPIDGTKGFLRGGQYAVALALIEDGRVQIGALGCPALGSACYDAPDGPGSVVIAARGQGAWHTTPDRLDDMAPLRVSNHSRPRDARILRSFEAGHTNVDKMSELARALGAEAEPVLMDSQAKYAVLAAGAGDVLFRLLSPKQPDYRERIWDQAAGSLVVEEAGGKTTDLDGTPLDFSRGRTLAGNRGVLASNERLHDAALAALRTVGA